MTFARSLAFLTYIIPRPIEVGAEAASAAFLFPRHRRRRIVGIALEKEETARRVVGFGGRGREREREKTAILRYPRLLHPLPRYLLDSRVAQKQPPEWKPSDKHCLSDDDLAGCPNFKSYIFGGLLSGVSCHRLARWLSLGSFYEDGLRPPRARTA